MREKKVSIDLRIEIAAEEVVCRQNGEKAFSAPMKDFVSALADRADVRPFPEMIPDGVRFVRRRGNVVVLVVEDTPQLRTVQWLANESTVPFGKNAAYRKVRLAFPFVVSVLAFRDGGLTGFQQCFYRTAPLSQLSDPLFLPNMFNVANGHGQQCWLCLANLKVDLRALSWKDKLQEIRQHLWYAGFNKSSEVHEGNSYWSTMRQLDPRFKTVETWEKASLQNRYFPLEVEWKASGQTVGGVLDQMFGFLTPPPVTTVTHLAQLVSLLAHRNARRSSPPADEAK
jgi:hypothetical protein